MSLVDAGLKPGHLFGCSTQDLSVHAELSTRLSLPYALLSDQDLLLQQSLKLSTHGYQGQIVLRRITLAIDKGRVVKVWYPITQPVENVNDVLGWLKEYSP